MIDILYILVYFDYFVIVVCMLEEGVVWFEGCLDVLL